MSVCQTIDRFRQKYMKLQNTKKVIQMKKMKMKFQYELRGSLYERAVFVKLLSSSDKKYMKLQTTNKFDIQKGKTEKKTPI